MRLRQLVLACGLASYILSSGASALGLGEATVKSSLNQPLQAEIKLLDTRDLTAEQILIALASPADFERNGVDRPYFYTEFQFDVQLNAAGGPKVIVTSYSPVREPYLNFLIEAKWSAGRLLREYTLLMDLPTFDDRAAAPSVSAVTTSPVATEVRRAAPAARAERSATPIRELNSDQYQVRANDTLWDIAKGMSRASGASIHQVMMSLYEANPEAFINGNINKLRSGQVLRVPPSSEMSSRNRAEAVRQFAVQTQQSSGSAYGAQLNASSRQLSQSTEPTDTAGRVTLSAPTAEKSGQGSGANSGRGAALESELATTLEELDRTKSENAELASRIRDLEDQVKTMESLVSLSSEQLTAMQVAAQQTQLNDDNAVAVVSDKSSASNAATSQAASSVAPAVVKSVQSPQKEITILDRITEYSPWLGLGAILLLGGGYLAYRRRKQDAVEDADTELHSPSFDVGNYSDVDDASTPVSDELDLDYDHLSTDEAPLDDEDSDVSPLDRADIYSGFGQYDRAEQVLKNAIKQDSNNSAYHEKLLDIYRQQDNREGVAQQQAVLMALGTAAAVTAGSLATASQNEAEQPTLLDDDEFNFELSDEDLSISEPLELSDETLDFELTLEDELNRAESPLVETESTELTLDDEFLFELADDLPTNPSVASELTLDDLELDEINDLTESDSAIVSKTFEDALFPGADLTLSPAQLTLAEHEEEELLEVTNDDFDLDLDVGDVDLAALDNEMDSLGASDNLLTPLQNVEPETQLSKSQTDLDLFDADLANLEAAFDESDFLTLDTNDAAPAPLETSSELDFNDEDLANLESAFDLSEFDVEEAASLSLNEIDAATENTSLSAVTQLEKASSLDESDIDDLLICESELSLDTELSLDDVEEFGEVVSEEGTNETSEASLEDFLATHSVEGAVDELELSLDDDIEIPDGFTAEELALSDDELDAELDFLAEADEAATKLDLARAYIDMGDAEGAKDILSEVMQEGNSAQQSEANELLRRLDA